MRNKRYYFFRHNLEAFIWLIALVLLAFNNPAADHYSLCPLHNLGWDFCPGCGLGSSISWFFRGDVAASFQSHPLGIFAIIILTYRIIRVFRTTSRSMKIIFNT